MDRKYLYWLLAFVVFKTAFTAVPNLETDYRIGFLFNETKLYPQTWMHYLDLHLVTIFTAFLMWKFMPRFVNVFRVYFQICVFNAVIYLLKYDSSLIKFEYFTVSTHIFTGLWLAYVIINEPDKWDSY